MPRRKGFNLSQWAIEHAALTRYLLVVLTVLGAAAYFQLGQDEDPPFVYRVMAMRTYWTGATAQQVAEQVTDRLEKVLQEVPYALNIRSYSKPGESQIIFIIRDSSHPADVPNIWYTVRKRVGDMRASMPQGVQGPFFNDEFGDVYGVIYALDSDGGFTWAEMKEAADHARQELLRVPEVAKVEFFGVQDEKVFVEVSQKRLSQFGLDLGQVLAQFAQQNAVASAGTVQTRVDVVQVRVGGQFRTIGHLAAMPIRGSSGQQLRLADIAHVHRGYIDPPQAKVRHQGKEVIALGVAMAKGGDIIRLGRELKAASGRIDARLPAGLRLVQLQDQPRSVAVSINEFVKVLVEAVVIVLAVSFVSLGLRRRSGGEGVPLWRRWSLDVRPGVVVAITIPLVLAVTFLVMYFLGIGLHKISLGSLIIALGLLVDDAIIAVEMMVRKLEEGYDKVRAACFAYEVTAMPMLTGTLITATGFLPIGMARSTVGEYTFAIFGVTVAALVVSWFASVYFVPYLGTRLFKQRADAAAAAGHEVHAGTGTHENFDTPFYRGFRRLVHGCVSHCWITIALTLLTFGLGVVGMGRVQQQFFPDSNRPEIMLELWSPEGTALAANEAVVRRVEQRLIGMPGVHTVSSWVGSGVPRFYLPLEQIFPQTNVSQLIVLPSDLAARERLRRLLPGLLAAEFPEVRGRLKLLPNGPPVAYPVQFRVLGPDPQKLRPLADEVKTAMRANARTRGVNDNWNESVKAVRLEIDQDKARLLGVSSQSIADSARAATTGSTVGQFRDHDKLIDVVLRESKVEGDVVNRLAQGYLPTASGRSIPLSQIARPQLEWEPGVLWREGRSYAITVQSDVADGTQPATVTAELLPRMRELEAKWPAGYAIKVAGAVEESGKGSASIAAGVPIMLFITFTLLMLQLHSFSRSMLVFVTGPLGIAGVAGALLLLDRPFGFVALLGVIALMGMIQRNAVILIDQIEQDRARGVPAWDAVVEASVRRLRPIVLTAAAAVLAMIPLSRSLFWGPMAVAIMGGLVVATVLTLLALPAMYAACFRVRR